MTTFRSGTSTRRSMGRKTADAIKREKQEQKKVEERKRSEQAERTEQR